MKNLRYYMAGSIAVVFIIVMACDLISGSQPSSNDSSTDSMVYESYNQAVIARNKYESYVWMQRERVYNWQLNSSRVLFWTSIGITITGVLFAIWQFSEANSQEQRLLESRPQAEPNNRPPDKSPGAQFKDLSNEQPSTSEASPSEGVYRTQNVADVSVTSGAFSLVFKTRSLAALIMLMSLLYLSLYVAFIYPVNNNMSPCPESIPVHAPDSVSVEKLDTIEQIPSQEVNPSDDQLTQQPKNEADSKFSPTTGGER